MHSVRRFGGPSGPAPRGAPDAEFQLRFLADVQRIFEEGSFTASYKFALLQAIADLAVCLGDDSAAPLRLTTRAISERIVELYWRQVSPWIDGNGAVVLRQNTQRNAAILTRVAEVHRVHGGRLGHARARVGEWRALVREVEKVVCVMPLWKLQVVGGEVHDFLYEQVGRGREITLRPGVAHCLRTFHPLISELVQSRWARFVQERNAERFNGHLELRDFLFGASRQSLVALVEPLRDLQDGVCLYCERSIRGEAHIDHFIPWSRYPSNLGHNLVLAHDRCNAQKSDHIAAVEHLERWELRNREMPYALAQAFDHAGVGHELAMTRQIARWAYAQVEKRRGLVWQEATTMVPLTGSWDQVLAG